MKLNVSKIKGLMAENNHKQVDLANKLNINVNTLHAYFVGKTAPKIDTVAKVAEIYGVHPFDLLIV